MFGAGHTGIHNRAGGIGKTLNDLFGPRSQQPQRSADDSNMGDNPSPDSDANGSQSQNQQTPQQLFKTLRRLHGQNLDHAGLNDLTDAFQSFITRARFFAIGRIRRTWSHSAVEFMKYRRRLPALMGGDEDECADGDDQFSMSYGCLISARRPSVGSSSTMGNSRQNLALMAPPPSDSTPTEDKPPTRVQISNIAPSVTASQLTSFLSKFGPVATCQVPTETVKSMSNDASSPNSISLNPYQSLPRRRGKGVAFVTFKTIDGANAARLATTDDLRFYGRVLVVSQPPVKPSSSRRRQGMSESTSDRRSVQDDEDAMSLCSSLDYSVDEPVDEAVSPFDVFEDRLLVQVFTYLNVVERIRIERVCKRWMELSYKSWSSCKHLRITSEQLSVGGRIRPLQTSWLCSLLHRCGRYVQSLDLSATPHLLDDTTLDSIALNCPNLKSINLSGLRLRWQSVKTFAEVCNSLEQVIFCNGETTGEKVFWHLFRGCQNLRRVELTGCRRLQGRCFRLLGLWLDQVILDGCYRLEPEAIEEMCLKSPGLSVLKLDECYNVNDACLNLMSRSLHNITSLSLCGPHFSGITSNGLINLSHLSTLRDLRFDYQQSCDDSVIDALTDGLPSLTSISVQGCNKLTADAIVMLGTWAGLTHVNISHVQSVNDDCVSQLLAKTVNLQSIKMRAAPKLTTKVMMAFASCPDVNNIDMSGCLQLDANSIRALIKVINEQPASVQHHVLLVIGGTKCGPNDVSSIQKSIAGGRILLDTADYTGSSFAPKFVPASSKPTGIVDEMMSDDDYTSDDEFESLTQHRSFIMDRLEEDELIPPDGQPFQDWDALKISFG